MTVTAERPLSDELRQALRTEYWKLADLVGAFDQRLLTVKGWGVTLSLAALAWGFEKGHYGLFLVSALSAAGFWAIEGVYKRHQMRTYLRMRDIEVVLWQRSGEPHGEGERVSSPLIDWTWKQASHIYARGPKAGDSIPKPYGRIGAYWRTWGFAGVALPHAISFIAGLVLFFLGQAGQLGSMKP